MPSSPEPLLGSRRQRADTALLIVDMINDLEFAEGAQLLPAALAAGRAVAALKQRAKRAGVPVIYVNDNFGRWRSDLSRLVRHCLADGVRGRPLVEMLAPDEDDYFVLKPALSGFYSTTLDLLLRHLAVERLVLTGVAANLCLLFTATDAHMRGYRLAVPPDCTAANTPQDTAYALGLMRRALDADVRPSRRLDVGRTRAPGARGRRGRPAG